MLIGGIETCIKKTATITTASNEEEARPSIREAVHKDTYINVFKMYA